MRTLPIQYLSSQLPLHTYMKRSICNVTVVSFRIVGKDRETCTPYGIR